MANKKEAKKAHRKENRIKRGAEKTQRRKTHIDHDGPAQLEDSIEKRNEPEDVNQAAARIVREATKD